MSSKIVGIIPARMAATRFPGKPLYPILGRPMIDHVYSRARKFQKWENLFIATCDSEIQDFATTKKWPVLMTSDQHIRCLDRVSEAIDHCGINLTDQDIVVCVQGDEPLLNPAMIEAVIQPLIANQTARGTVLAMHIIEEDQWRNPDTVKIIHDLKGNVLYTSRSPVPYAKVFSTNLGARRIYGLFAFRISFLRWFARTPPSPLEIAESCDSNRICDNGLGQIIAPYPYEPSYSVDSPSDILRVEKAMKNDSLWGTY